MNSATRKQPTNLDSPAFYARIRERDTEALAAVVRAYLGQIVRAALGAGLDAASADDVAQATFSTFIEVAPRFEGRSTLRTWLFGILFRKIHEARRAGKRNDQDNIDEVFESRFDSGGSWQRPPTTPEMDFEAAEARIAIADCLGGAPERQRAAFTLREIEGMTTPEICKILAVSRTNLGVLLHRVRNRLRECLEIKGITP